MDLGLTGKRVIVTGASKGIGLAIARSFLDEGAHVAICSRGEEALVAAADDLAQHGTVHHRTADMADPDAPASFVNWAADQMGGLDVLVSNVSGFGANDWESSCAIDLVAMDKLVRAGLERMEDHVDANVICIGSRAANVGAPRIAAYAGVKAATVSAMKSLSREVARRGIRANVVSPGDIIFEGGTWEHIQQTNEKLFAAVVKENPFRRLGTPQEIADVVAFVASPRASFVTGSNVLVDGGATGGLQI